MSDETNTISIDTVDTTTIYAKGDTCLLINPFDTFHLFRVYKDWKTSSPSLMNLSNSDQKFYLVFKNNKKEIRVSEYSNSGSTYTIDKSNGEILFKITKEQATNILSLGSSTFYITSKYEGDDGTGNTTYTSSEEVLFVGTWADESKYTSASLTSQVTSLKKQLQDSVSQCSTLTSQVETLTATNNTLQATVDDLNEQVESLNEQIDTLNETIDKYEEANEFTSVVISDNATYSYYNGDKEVDENGHSLSSASKNSLILTFKSKEELEAMTEEELREYVEYLQTF